MRSHSVEARLSDLAASAGPEGANQARPLHEIIVLKQVVRAQIVRAQIVRAQIVRAQAVRAQRVSEGAFG